MHVPYLYVSAMVPMGCGMDEYMELNPAELKGSRPTGPGVPGLPSMLGVAAGPGVPTIEYKLMK